MYPRRAVTRCHTYEIAYRFHYTCANASCGHVYGRHSRSIDTEKLRCGRCGNGHLVLSEAPGGAAAVPVPAARGASHAAAGAAAVGAGAGASSGRAVLGEMSAQKAPRTPSAYQAFMAANRKAVAASLPPGTTPQQVMAAVARLWKEQKAAQAAGAGAGGGAGALAEPAKKAGSDVHELSVNLSSRLNIIDLESEE